MLDDQIEYLKRSAELFDNGATNEAVRLAVTLRLLLHDTGSSKSLLGQLNMKNRDFYDSSIPYNPHNLSSHLGLISVAVGPPGTRYVAMLDDAPGKIREVPFSDWWNNVIFADAYKKILSRKDLILTAVNQDGGAHVDTKLDGTYAAFTKEGALGWRADREPGKRMLEQPECMAIRQITHEVLKTLIPGYAKRPKLNASAIIGDVSITPVGPPPQKSLDPAHLGRKIGRNEPCPCGSGMKYKKCCGR